MRLRVRLRGRGPLTVRPDLPSVELSRALSEWLAGPRGRLLRRAAIGLRQRILDIGCGHGIVTEELLRRAGGAVVALDRDIAPARRIAGEGALLVEGDAACLPFADASFDLALCQNVLLWVADVEAAVSEMARVLTPGGVAIAVEPDYGGMMEWPPQVALRDVWLRATADAGAEPQIGRRLPGLFERAGFHTWVELQHLPRMPDAAACDLLLELPLSAAHRERIGDARRALDSAGGGWGAFIHVPYFLVMGTRPERAAAPHRP